MSAPDYAWVGLVVFINVYWTVYDFVLAPRFGWPTMTGQMRHYLHETVAGPLIFGLLAYIPAAFLYHIFETFAKQR